MRFRWYGVAALLLLAMDAGAQAWAPRASRPRTDERGANDE